MEPLRGKLEHDPFKSKGKTTGLFVVTNLRVIWCSSVMGVGETKILPCSEVTSIDCKTHAITGMGTVRVQGLTLLFIIDLKLNDANSAIEALNRQKVMLSMPLLQKAPVQDGDYIIELERLKAHVEKGVISQDDYEKKKKQILGI